MAQKGNTKDYVVRLKLETGTAQKQVEQVTQDVREMIANLSTAEDKFSVFKKLAKYLSDLDEKLSKFRSDNTELFNQVFGVDGKENIDLAVANVLQSIGRVPAEVVDRLNLVLSGISDAGKVKGATDDIKQLANAINALYLTVGQKRPFNNIKQEFGGSENFAERIGKITAALKDFRVEWGEVIRTTGSSAPAAAKRQIIEAAHQKTKGKRQSGGSATGAEEELITSLFGGNGAQTPAERPDNFKDGEKNIEIVQKGLIKDQLDKVRHVISSQLIEILNGIVGDIKRSDFDAIFNVLQSNGVQIPALEGNGFDSSLFQQSEVVRKSGVQEFVKKLNVEDDHQRHILNNVQQEIDGFRYNLAKALDITVKDVLADNSVLSEIDLRAVYQAILEEIVDKLRHALIDIPDEAITRLVNTTEPGKRIGAQRQAEQPDGNADAEQSELISSDKTKTMSNQLSLINKMVKAYEKLAEVQDEGSDAVVQEAEDHIKELENEYYGVIATMRDGSKITATLNDIEFTDNANKILENKQDIQNIKMIPRSAQAVVEAADGIDRAINGLSTYWRNLDTIERAVGSIPPDTIAAKIDYLTRAMQVIETHDGSFEFVSEEQYTKASEMVKKLETLRSRKLLTDDFGEELDRLQMWDDDAFAAVTKDIREGTLTTIDQCISKYKELTAAANGQSDAVKQTNQGLQEQVRMQQQINDGAERTSHSQDVSDPADSAPPQPQSPKPNANVPGEVSSTVAQQMEELRKLEEYLTKLQGLISILFDSIKVPENAFEPLKADLNNIETSVDHIVQSINSIREFATGTKLNTNNSDATTQNIDFASLFTPVKTVLDQIYGVLKGFTGIAASGQDSVEVKKPVEQTPAARVQDEGAGNIEEIFKSEQFRKAYTHLEFPAMREGDEALFLLHGIVAKMPNFIIALQAWHNALRDHLAPVDEMARRISTNAKIPKSAVGDEAYFELSRIAQRLSEVHESPSMDNEEYVTLQYKFMNMLDDIIQSYGGVKGSGAKDGLQLRWSIYDDMKNITGYDIRTGSAIDAIYGQNDFSIVGQRESDRLTMRSMAAKLLKEAGTFTPESLSVDWDYKQLSDIGKVLSYIQKVAPELMSQSDNSSPAQKNGTEQAAEKQEEVQQIALSENINGIWQEFNTLIQKIRDTMNSVTADLGRVVGKQSIAQGDGEQLDIAQPGTLAQEVTVMENLSDKVKAVADLVAAKNNAFENEPGIVKTAVEREIVDLNNLKTNLEELKTFIGTIFENMKVPEDAFGSLTPIIDQIKTLSAELQILHNNFALQGVSDALPDAQQSSTWLSDLANNIDAVAKAIDAKTTAFKQEDEVVRAAVQAETESLKNLKGLLVEIQNVLQTIFSVDVQKFGNVDFEQDKNNVSAVSGVLKNIQQLLGQIYGVLKGFTGIEAQDENSLQAKAPVISGETRTDEQAKNLSILSTILGTLQSIDNYFKANPFEPVKNSVDQLTEVAKAKDAEQKGEKGRTKDSLSQLITTLTPAVKTLQDVANGIVVYQKSAKSKTDVADRRIADKESYDQIRDVALSTVKDRVMKGGDSAVTEMKALPDGVVQVKGYIQTATEAWEGFTLQVNQLNEASELAWNTNAKAAKAAKDVAGNAVAFNPAETAENALEVLREAQDDLRADGRKNVATTVQYQDSGRWTKTQDEVIGGLTKRTFQTHDDFERAMSRTTVTLSDKVEKDIGRIHDSILQEESKLGNIDLLNKYKEAYSALETANKEYGARADSLSADEIADWNTKINLVQEYGNKLSAEISKLHIAQSETGKATVAKKFQEYQAEADFVYQRSGLNTNEQYEDATRKGIIEDYLKIIEAVRLAQRSGSNTIDPKTENGIRDLINSLHNKTADYHGSQTMDVNKISSYAQGLLNDYAKQGKEASIRFTSDSKYIITTLEKIGGLTRQVTQIFDENDRLLDETAMVMSNRALAKVEQLRAMSASQDRVRQDETAYTRFDTELQTLDRLTAEFSAIDQLSDEQIAQWGTQIKLVQDLGANLLKLVELRQKLGSQDDMPTDAQKLKRFETTGKQFTKGLDIDLLPVGGETLSAEQQAVVNARDALFKKIDYLRKSKATLTSGDERELEALLLNLKTAADARKAILNPQQIAQKTYAQDLKAQQKGFDTYREKLQGIDIVAANLTGRLDLLAEKLANITESGDQAQLDEWKKQLSSLQGEISDDIWQQQHQSSTKSADMRAQTNRLFQGLDFNINDLNLTGEQDAFVGVRRDILDKLDRLNREINQGRKVDFTEVEGNINKLSSDVATYRTQMQKRQTKDKQAKKDKKNNDAFIARLSKEQKGFERYEQSIQSLGIASEELQKRLRSLRAELNSIGDDNALEDWKYRADQLKRDIATENQVRIKKALEAPSQIGGEMNASFRELNFKDTDKNLTDEQKEILNLRNKLIQQLSEYEIRVRRNQQVEMDGINQTKKALDGKIEAYVASSKFNTNLMTQEDKFKDYKEKIGDISNMSVKLATELQKLEAALGKIGNQDGLNQWTKSFEDLQARISVAQQVDRKQKTRYVQDIWRSAEGKLKGLGFKNEDAVYDRIAELQLKLNSANNESADQNTIKNIQDEQVILTHMLEVREKLNNAVLTYNAHIQNGLKADRNAVDTLQKELNAVVNEYQSGGYNAGGTKKSIYGTGIMNSHEKKRVELDYMIAHSTDLSRAANDDTTDFAAKLQAYEASLENIRKLYAKFATTKPTAESEQEFRQASVECNRLGKEVENVIKAYNKLHDGLEAGKKIGLDQAAKTEEDRKKTLKDYVTSLHGVDTANLKFSNEFREVTYTINNGDGTITHMRSVIDNLGTSIVNLAGDTEKAKTKMQTFFGEVGKKFAPLMTYLVSMTGVEEIFQQVRNGIQYVRDIDLALTELKKVTSETDATYDAFLQSMSKTANVVGSTVSELTTMAAEWSKLGYNIEESAQLAESTAILLNVSEFQDATSASEALISTMQAFGYAASESQHVVDILNEVGNNYAISSDGLAIALQDSASALMEGGNNLEQAVAMIAAANRVVQDPNSVGKQLCRH